MELINGQCFWLKSEKELDIAMGLAGCAPAWMALVAEALSDGAVKLGLSKELSYAMIAGMFEGVGVTLAHEQKTAAANAAIRISATQRINRLILDDNRSNSV